jgi:hypothetical protein
MNRVVTSHVEYRGSIIPVEDLKDNSNIKVIVECLHGQREVRWNRRHQLCRKCVADQGLYNTSKPGREISWGDKISEAKKGIKFSEQHKRALSVAQYGVAQEDWPGFYIKGELHKIRDSIEYKEFRKAAMKRDNYTCRITGMRGKLNVHHLEGVTLSPEKVLDLNNVITLHSSVHKLFHDIYGRGYNTSEQFQEFLLKIKEEMIYG